MNLSVEGNVLIYNIDISVFRPTWLHNIIFKKFFMKEWAHKGKRGKGHEYQNMAIGWGGDCPEMEPEGGGKPRSLHREKQLLSPGTSSSWGSSSSLCAPSLDLPNRDALGHPHAGLGARTPEFESSWTLGCAQSRRDCLCAAHSGPACTTGPV